MKIMKKLVVVSLIMGMMCTMVACSGSEKGKEGKKTITIAYQGGIGYAPIHVMETEKLIENNYDGEITVEFKKLDSGAAINEGIMGGTIDIGCMGIAPAISGVSAGIGYKVISNLCSQSHGLMSNDKDIQKLTDIKDEKIALVNTGSIQHILLAMAAEKELGDAHALDNNIQAMSHAEGMASLESGTVTLHLTSSPFIYQERANEDYVELKEINEVWPSGNSFLVAMASTKLAEDEKLFEAVTAAFEDSFEFMYYNMDVVSGIEAKYLDLDLDTVKMYLNEMDCKFFPELIGVDTMADFMKRAGFIDKEVNLDDLKYDTVNVK